MIPCELKTRMKFQCQTSKEEHCAFCWSSVITVIDNTWKEHEEIFTDTEY